MKTFANIAANPTFARNVKELIYDGRLFLPEIGNYATYLETFGDRMMEEHDAYDTSYQTAFTNAERGNVDKIYECSIWNSKTLGVGNHKRNVRVDTMSSIP